MVYGGYSYIDFKYTPDKKNDFVVLLWASGEMPIEKIAEAIAAESSIGTWTEIKTMNEYVLKKLRARIFRIDKVGKNAGWIWAAYPIEHFDVKNPLQFVASVLGNIFGLKELKSLVVLDIHFPERYQRNFSGPLFGLKGLRKYLGTEKDRRPHLGTIVKPKVGLTPHEFAAVAYDAYIGGVDFVKDDENLVDQTFCPFEQRVHEMLKVIDKVEAETGRKVLYSPNITDSYSRMLEKIDFLKEHGWMMAMIDVYVIGFSGLVDIIKELQSHRMYIHGHRAGYAAVVRGAFGIQFQIFEKFYRLFGVDQLHIGTGVGKMEGAPLLIRRLRDIAVNQKGEEKLYLGSLLFKWDPKIMPMMPVASGGLDPGMMEALVALQGTDLTIQAGGGIHGHPEGTKAGAAAMRQAADAVIQGIPLPEYAKRHAELAAALKKWKYLKPDSIKKLIEQEEKNKDKLNITALKKPYKTFGE